MVVKVHTSGKLKGHIDVQKKGRTSTVTLHGGNKREVRLAESISEEGGANINANALSPTEQQLAVGLRGKWGTFVIRQRSSLCLPHFVLRSSALACIRTRLTLPVPFLARCERPPSKVMTY